MTVEDFGFPLVIERRMAAPPSRLWACWADPALLARWWCPAPWTTEVVAFEFRPGGAFAVAMRGPEETGGESSVDGCFLEIVPERRVVFTTALGSGWRPMEPWLAITAIIDLDPAEGGTHYRARCLHRSVADRDKHDGMGFAHGWDICLGQLDALAGGL